MKAQPVLFGYVWTQMVQTVESSKIQLPLNWGRRSPPAVSLLAVGGFHTSLGLIRTEIVQLWIRTTGKRNLTFGGSWFGPFPFKRDHFTRVSFHGKKGGGYMGAGQKQVPKTKPWQVETWTKACVVEF